MKETIITVLLTIAVVIGVPLIGMTAVSAAEGDAAGSAPYGWCAPRNAHCYGARGNAPAGEVAPDNGASQQAYQFEGADVAAF